MKKKIRIERDFFGNITRYEETRSNSMFDSIFDDDEEVIVVDQELIRLGRLRRVEVDDDDESGEVAAAAFIGSAVGSLLGSLLGSNKKK